MRGGPLHRHLDDFVALFEGFHPARLPVLWRILALQYVLQTLFLALQQDGSWEKGRAAEIVATMPIDLDAFDWRTRPDEASDDDVLEPFEVARAHLIELVGATEERLSES